MAMCSIYKYGSKAQGVAFLAFGSISFLVFVYVAIVSKLLPPFDNPILAAIQNDRILLLSGSINASHPRCCNIFPLAQYEDLQACITPMRYGAFASSPEDFYDMVRFLFRSEFFT
ncbi:hypothetical protein P3L10_028998 [Capsicum annuum]